MRGPVAAAEGRPAATLVFAAVPPIGIRGTSQAGELLLGTDGDHNTAGLKATAMRLVNAVPAVVGAKPGLVTALDLPLVTGKGLVRT